MEGDGFLVFFELAVDIFLLHPGQGRVREALWGLPVERIQLHAQFFCRLEPGPAHIIAGILGGLQGDPAYQPAVLKAEGVGEHSRVQQGICIAGVEGHPGEGGHQGRNVAGVAEVEQGMPVGKPVGGLGVRGDQAEHGGVQHART